MSRVIKILLIEDVDTDADLVLYELRSGGIAFEHVRVETEPALYTALTQFTPDIVLSDFSLPQMMGASALDIVHGCLPEVPFVFVSGTIGEERAVELLRDGATDYVLKTNLVRLAPVVRRALAEADGRIARLHMEKQLRDSEQRFRLMVEGLKDHALFMLDIEGHIASWNGTAERLYGYPATTAETLQMAQLYLPEDIGTALNTLLEAVKDGRSEIETWHQRADGSRFWANAITAPLYDEGKSLLGYVQIVRDLSERREQERRIARLNRIYAVLSGINSVIVRSRDRHLLLEEVCQIAVTQGGFALAWVGMQREGRIQLIASRGVPRVAASTLSNTLAPTPTRASVQKVLHSRAPLIRNDLSADHDGLPLLEFYREQDLHSSATLPLVVDGTVIGVLELYSNEAGFFSQDELRLLLDLTGDIWFALEYIAKEEKLDYLAFYDALTGLPNRRLCGDRLNQHLASLRHESQSLALILLDVERFHFINDTYGRQAGDMLLKRVAEQLGAAVAEPHFICRMGADCFGVVLHPVYSGAEAARYLSEHLLPFLNQPFTVADKEVHVAFKAGITVAPFDGNDADTLIFNTEAALKKAKLSASPFTFFLPQMQAQIVARMHMENQLRDALTNEEFVLHYQPKLDLASKRVVGMEGLIRWQHPQRGLIYPGDFIPLLEETGLIVEVGAWVIRQALGDAAVLLAAGLTPPRIAVNVSAVQLRREDFVDEVAGLLRGHVAGQWLDLEITESMVMENMANNAQKLERLRDLGVKLSIDDFGTGYSSLSYIASLPVDALKIDRSFVTHMTESPNKLSIVTTVISLAHALGFQVIAEGVETEDQAKLLHLLRCDQAQGFLYSKPKPLGQIIDLLRS